MWGYQQTIVAVLGILGGCITVAKAAATLAASWTRKTEAIGRKALSEELLAGKVQELRDSFAKFMERMSMAEARLLVLETRADERRRARADTKGVPLVAGDD